MSGKRMILIAGIGVMLILAIAWFDGGEEPLRPITQPVAQPGSSTPPMPEPAQ